MMDYLYWLKQGCFPVFSRSGKHSIYTMSTHPFLTQPQKNAPTQGLQRDCQQQDLTPQHTRILKHAHTYAHCLLGSPH